MISSVMLSPSEQFTQKENHNLFNNSSAENQKGLNAVQRCSIENHKGAIAIDYVQR